MYVWDKVFAVVDGPLVNIIKAYLLPVFTRVYYTGSRLFQQDKLNPKHV